MKIKVKPEDFVVEEILKIKPLKSGPYTLLKLEKKFWNTLDVIDFVARRMGVSTRLFSRAGLKDRYSFSTQYLSFKGDFTKGIQEKNFKIIPIGKIARELDPSLLKENRFTITIRSLEQEEIERVYRNYFEIKEYGLPNYFDEQRFGSARHRQGFFARLLMLGHYKGALKLLVCYPCQEDNQRLKKFKKFCAENWGKWEECLHLAPFEFRKMIGYLVKNPKDFKGAIKMLSKEMLNLYLLAYQSYIFNQVLNLIVKNYGIGISEVPYSMGRFIFYRSLKDKNFIEKLTIPMLNEKVVLTGYLEEKIAQVLSEEGISLRSFCLSKMRLRGVRFKTFFRPAIFYPEDFFISEFQNDEIYQGKKKLLIKFTLKPGSYATLLVRRLFL